MTKLTAVLLSFILPLSLRAENWRYEIAAQPLPKVVKFNVAALAVAPIKLDRLGDLINVVFPIETPLPKDMHPEVRAAMEANLLDVQGLIVVAKEVKIILDTETPIMAQWKPEIRKIRITSPLSGITVIVNPSDHNGVLYHWKFNELNWKVWRLKNKPIHEILKELDGSK